MNKRKLYNSIMESISKEVKRALNEYNILGVEVDSMQQGKMSDITDIYTTIPYNQQKITKLVEDIFKTMFTIPEYITFLKKWMPDTTIEWSPKKVNTACTDGHTGRLVMNPDFMQRVVDSTAEKSIDEKHNLGVQFIILHEAMHNYYNIERHAQEIKTPYDNIIIDKRINNEIIQKWPKLKGIPEIIGALL